MHLRKTIAIALATTAAVIAAGTALATQGSGVAAVVHARGTLGEHFKLKLRNSSNPGDAIVQQITIAPGGHTGWHTHPGPALVIVKSGQLTLDEAHDCSSRTYVAGQLVVDSGYGNVHRGRNTGTTPTELWVTYLDVPVGGSFRIDAPAPARCP